MKTESILNDNWRLVSGMVAYIITDKKDDNTTVNRSVYLSPTGKKSYENAVVKCIPTNFTKFVINDEDCKFQIKIDDKFNIFIKYKGFPEKDEWYLVENTYFDSMYFGEIFTQVENNKGNFDNKYFEAVFSDKFIDKVFFINDEMNVYNSAFQEFRRRINCQLCKKTKKWIPGHRYDSEKSTYYYLGEFVTRLNEDGLFLDDSSVRTIHLVESEIDKSDKSISDVIKRGVKNFTMLDSLPSMVDSGKVLEDDGIQDIQVYWDEMIQNTLSNIGSKNQYGFVQYNGTARHLFNIFSIQSKGNLKYNLSEESKDKIKKLIKDMLIEDMLIHWDNNHNRADSNLSSSNSVEQNLKNLKNLFFRNIVDQKIRKNIYYLALIDKLGLDFAKLVETTFLSTHVKDLVFDSSFDNYVKFGSIYLPNHPDCNSDKVSVQRVNSTNYSLNFVSLEDLYASTTELKGVLKTICKEALDNFGAGVKTYYSTNVGNYKNKKIYITMKVDIQDIKDYFKINNIVMSSTIEREIIETKFWNVTLTIDQGAEVK